MMKKLLCLLCMLCLLLGALPAQAQTQDPCYTLVTLDAEGRTVCLGTAVQFQDAVTLLTTRWAAETQEPLYAMDAGGQRYAVTQVTIPCEGSDLRLLTLAEAPGSTPIPLGEADDVTTVLGATKSGRISETASHITLAAYEGDPAILYTGVEGLLPGALLLNSKGELVGLTSAAYGEGIARYVAYPAEVITARMTGQAPGTVIQPEADTVWMTGFTVTQEKGVMTIDWSACAQPEETMDGVLTLFWEVEGNRYFSYSDLDWSEGTATLAAMPGRTCYLWLQYAREGEAQLDAARTLEQSLAVAVEQLPPFTDHQFKDVRMFLGASPSDSYDPGTTQVEPMAVYTVEALTQPDTVYCMQVEGTYQVTEEISANMLMTLTAPDGSVYMDLSGYIFLPELCESDVWNADITRLVTNAMQFGTQPRGEYVLAYYLDGQLATECRFTVE